MIIMINLPRQYKCLSEKLWTFEGTILQKSKESFIYLNEAWFSQTIAQRKSILNHKKWDLKRATDSGLLVTDA